MPGHGAWAGGKEGTYRRITLRKHGFFFQRKISCFLLAPGCKVKTTVAAYSACCSFGIHCAHLKGISELHAKDTCDKLKSV